MAVAAGDNSTISKTAAAKAAAATGTGALAGTPPPLTTQQITQQAQTQTNNETAQETNPLNTQIGTLQTEQGQAAADITGEFNAIQPVVNQGATAVKQGYDAAQVAEQGIFTAAQQRMNEMAQGQAQQAQMLSQQIGAPVAVDSFTAPYTTGAGELGALGAGQQLHTLAYAQAGEQEAQAFASQVFPLVRTEAQAQNRTTYQNQIKDLRSQISKIIGQKGALFDQHFNELQAAEKTYALNRAQLAETAANDLRNYNLKVSEDAEAKREADNNLAIAQQQADLDRDKFNHTLHEDSIADINTKRGLDIQQEGADTAAASQRTAAAAQQAEAAHLSAADANDAKRLGIDARTAAFNIAQAKKLAPLQLAKAKADNRIAYTQILENLVNPHPGATVTLTGYVTTTADTPGAIPSGKNPDGSTHWVKVAPITKLLPSTAIHDPSAVVRYLVASGESKKDAIAMVKSRFSTIGLPSDWKYGDKWPPVKKTGGPPLAKAGKISTAFNDQSGNLFAGAG